MTCVYIVVTPVCLQVSYNEKKQSLLDLLSVYAAGGKAIVFTRTKLGADEVAAAIAPQQPCEALHGDIAQSQREKTLSRFRSGDVSVLIATDVAARGLDIPNVDLVVHYDPPQDSESFLHRSGRTGRAGNKGRAIVMHTPSETKALGMILQQVSKACVCFFVVFAAACQGLFFSKSLPPWLITILSGRLRLRVFLYHRYYVSWAYNHSICAVYRCAGQAVKR